ncbi:MAG: gliding motility-associated-like protein [Saprospiraceae bacterium]|jgi:gliding motility-associated-like protein
MNSLIRKMLLPIWLLFSGLALYAQPVNDECNNAIILNDLNNWCSSPGQFTTVDATASAEASASCFPLTTSHDVWFAFIATANTVNIIVNGNTMANGGTLENPEVAIYSGTCGAGLVQEECISDAVGNNTVETFGGPLTLGLTYYLRVDARNENEGTFQLCINNFNQIPEPTSDCLDGVVLCDKSSFTVQSVLGAGNNTNEIDPASCIQDEISSVWYQWTCDQSGTLAFTLTPSQSTDDLDFAVFELPNGINNCSGKELIRCMASGENVGEPFANWEPCTGATGLSLGDSDTEEVAGCQAGNNNFVAAIDMQAGVSYALIVNNFSNTGSGFTIEWGGSGTFLGPLADFVINPELGVACEDEINIIDASIDNAGDIVSWNWNFGAGAIPTTANTEGPHDVSFNSVGTKFIVLTVESSAGCIVTQVLELEVEECCDPNSDLGINLVEAIDPNCNGESSGVITVAGSGGSPLYEYSLDGETYFSLSSFNSLPAGSYSIFVRDIKGCLDLINVTLVDPPPILVDAGEDVTIELGYDTDLDAIVSPGGAIVDYMWFPDSLLLSCSDCQDPNAFPSNTTEFTVTVTNLDGCTAEDEVTVHVIKNRPIYIPNAFSPNDDGNNDTFMVYGGRGARQIQLLRVFNRWGALLYEGRDIMLGDDSRGWDGTFKGEYMNSDVFTYYTLIEFIDNEVVLFKGDVTLVK